eukprot:9871228-Karenia_brevis.AAC.1
MSRGGFIKGGFNPCLVFHDATEIRALVWGDDFIVDATADQCGCFLDDKPSLSNAGENSDRLRT